MNQITQSPTPAAVSAVAPALASYAEKRLYGEVWKRPGLSERDRSVITVAALIGRNQTLILADTIDQAIENGVKPAEISEAISLSTPVGATRCNSIASYITGQSTSIIGGFVMR